jgi:hypothetical protein
VLSSDIDFLLIFLLFFFFSPGKRLLVVVVVLVVEGLARRSLAIGLLLRLLLVLLGIRRLLLRVFGAAPNSISMSSRIVWRPASHEARGLLRLMHRIGFPVALGLPTSDK